MQQYMGTMIYEHEKYIDDIKKKECYKQEIKLQIESLKFSFYKRWKIKRLINKLCSLKFLLEEADQKALVLNEEIWSSDCLEYNVNKVYDFISRNSVNIEIVETQILYKFCNVENDIDIKFIKMNDTLRKSKEKNPIIILVNDMFVKPFIINGNHRIRNAYNTGIEKLGVYIVNADDVIECLISEDYKVAFRIYQKLNSMIGMKLNC